MKTLTQTIIVIVAFSLLTAVLAQAQTNPPTTPVLPSASNTPANPPTPTPAPNQVPAPTLPNLQAVNDNLYSLTRGFSYGSQTSSTGTVLVIPSEQINTEDLLTINEDMSVMSRIFEKNIEQDRISTARSSMFVSRNDPFSMLLGTGRGGIQSMYLQGFGALFLMNVDFPLSPPPDVQDDEKETQTAEQGDLVWQQMKQQMYEPEKVDRRRRAEKPEEKYDAEKVENLKTTLIQSLKHAANIRSLKPGESVILTVTGSDQATGTTISSTMLSGGNQLIVSERAGDGNTRTRIVQGTSLDDIGSSSPTILVIRTKKSDIDEFAKGDLDFEKFRQRVQLLTYPLLGGADGYGDPFNPYMRRRSTGSSSRR